MLQLKYVPFPLTGTPAVIPCRSHTICSLLLHRLSGPFYNPFFCFYIDSFLFMKSNAKDFVARITLIMM